jgi:hypothetical protein
MNLAPFTGRKAELALLDELHHQGGAKFLVVYGRRRVGKSRLLSHWVNASGQRVLYWVASQKNQTELLKGFSQALYRFSHQNKKTPEGFAYSSWEVALEALADYAQQGPCCVIIDEFTYLAQAAPEFPSILQNAWDQRLKQLPLFLIISGSFVHMMMKTFHSYQAPLYGRASHRIHLQPLHYHALAQVFPAYSPEERVAVYGILGGIPAHWEFFDPRQNFNDNLQKALLQPTSLMQADALLLLHEQFDEPTLYLTILAAIAENKRTPKEISNFCSIPPNQVSRYLNTLAEVGLIERRVPVTDWNRSQSRKGRYYITDSYLRFYFRFIEPFMHLLILGQRDELLDNIRQHLRAFIGQYGFEELCRYWVAYMSNQRKLPLKVFQFGSYWGSDAQLDVMAISREDHKVLIGECKWGLEKVGPEVIEKLTRQAPKAISHLAEPAKWQPYLYLFTHTPLTEEAADLAVQHQVTVVTLEQLDADLRTEE